MNRIKNHNIRKHCEIWVIAAYSKYTVPAFYEVLEKTVIAFTSLISCMPSELNGYMAQTRRSKLMNPS